MVGVEPEAFFAPIVQRRPEAAVEEILVSSEFQRLGDAVPG